MFRISLTIFSVTALLASCSDLAVADNDNFGSQIGLVIEGGAFGPTAQVFNNNHITSNRMHAMGLSGFDFKYGAKDGDGLFGGITLQALELGAARGSTCDDARDEPDVGCFRGGLFVPSIGYRFGIISAWTGLALGHVKPIYSEESYDSRESRESRSTSPRFKSIDFAGPEVGFGLALLRGQSGRIDMIANAGAYGRRSVGIQFTGYPAMWNSGYSPHHFSGYYGCFNCYNWTPNWVDGFQALAHVGARLGFELATGFSRLR